MYQLRRGKRLHLFVREAEEWQGRALYQVIIEQAWQQGMCSATITRGIESFGPEHHLSTMRFPDIGENLPLIIEIVDTDEHIEAFLPILERFMQRGMLTSTPVEIILREEQTTR